MVLFTNCEKDNQAIKPQEIDPGTPISITNVSASEVSMILDLIGSSSDKASKSGFSPTPLGDVELDNILKVVDTIGNVNYSLLLLPENNNPNSFFNLVVSTSQTGTPNMAIIEYRMDDNFAKGFMDGTKKFSEFTGTLYKYPFTSYSELFSKETCVQNIDEIVICDETILQGGSSAGGSGTGNPLDPIGDGGNGDGSGSSSGSGTVITVSWVCDWRGSSHDSPGECTGPEGGQGPGTWTITIIRNPNPHTNKGSVITGKELTCCDDSYVEGTVGVNLTVQAISEIINCVGLLNTDQINALNVDGRKPIGLKIFLTANECSEDSKEQGMKIIEALEKGSLVSWFPFIKYPDSKAAQYKRDYPKLTEYLKNQLPKIGDNSTIVNAVKKYTNLSISQIKDKLKWGEGPTIKIEQIGSAYAKFRKELEPESIYLDIDLVNQMESSTPGSKVADALAFVIGVSVLHEFVHYGDYNYNGDSWQYPQEEGLLFEEEAYGQQVWIENAEIILKNNQ